MPAKPRMQGESDEAYNRRVANWNMSQERLKSVGITGGVNKASESQIKAFTDKYGHGPAGMTQHPRPDDAPAPKPLPNPNPSPAPKPNPSPRPFLDPKVIADRNDVRDRAVGPTAGGVGISKGPNSDSITGLSKRQLATGGPSLRAQRRQARRLKIASKTPSY